MTGFKQKILLHDVIVIAFSLLLTVFVVIGWEKLDHPGTFLLTHTITILLVIAFIYLDDGRKNSIFHWAHHWFPLVTLLTYYIESSILDNIFIKGTFDNLFLSWDLKLFGFSPSLEFSGLFNSLWINELFFMIYISYYLLLFVPGIFVFLKDENKLDELNLSLIVMMYCHFLFFIFVPADGPVSQSFRLFQDGKFFIPIMQFFYEVGEKGGGAFPSTHVAVAMLVFAYMRGYFPRLRPLFAFFCFGIILATVYCSFHYAVDSIAGFFTGWGFYFLTRKWILHRKDKGQTLFLAVTPTIMNKV